MSSLDISLIQTATHWHQSEKNRVMFDDLLSQIPSATQLVMLPEMFSTGFTMASAALAEPMDGATVQWMQQWAQRLNKVVCGSLIIAAAGEYFNRMVWAAPDGQLITYDKRHLFRMAGEDKHFSPGQCKVVVQLDGWRICLAVCYDLRFPVWLRNNDDYDLLLVVANWPAARLDAWQTLLRARAIENQAFCAGLNIVGRDGAGVDYAGGSAIYAGDGAAILPPQTQPGIFSRRLQLQTLMQMRQDFPVALDADTFSLNSQ